MELTRREMVWAALAAAVGVSLSPSHAVAGHKPQSGSVDGAADYIPMAPDLAMTREAFTLQLRQTFFAHRNGMPSVSLRLVQVTDSPSAVAAGTVGSQTCFTAFFTGPEDQLLLEGTYLIETPSYGRMELYLKPSQGTGRTIRYEAAFNRLDRASEDQLLLRQ